MKLQILIPQYKEDETVIKPLLDSIALQQIDLKEIGVIIVNDGSDVILDDKFLNSYPYQIDYYKAEHKGVSATRQYALDKATADYVMFCDADDMFFNACGLYIIFREMNNGQFDTLMSAFVEESRLNGETIYLTHDMDSTFVHGKIHRRKYLINNNIKWNEKLTIHEDSYFNILCQRLTDSVKYCKTAFYLWKWRDDSVCRHDPLYLNKTFVNMLDSNSELVRQFLDRNRKNDAIWYATMMIYDTYYALNCDRWFSEEGKEYVAKTEQRFKEYWDEFHTLFEECTQEIRYTIIKGVKSRYMDEGLMLERITFDDWIKKVTA